MILQIPKGLNHAFPTKYLQLPSTQGKREHLTILVGSPRLPGTYTETPSPTRCVLFAPLLCPQTSFPPLDLCSNTPLQRTSLTPNLKTTVCLL